MSSVQEGKKMKKNYADNILTKNFVLLNRDSLPPVF